MEKKREIKTFVRRAGRMSSLHLKGFEHYSDYVIPYTEDQLNIADVFPKKQPLILEIGFGMGDATIEIARTQPEKNFIGIEVHSPGVGKVLYEAGELNLQNIRVIHHDAIEVLTSMIPKHSLHGVHLFFADPWPKKKHFKRRIYSERFLSLLYELLEPSGYIYSVTDWEPYGEWMLDVASKDSRYTNPYGGFASPVPWRPTTKFESKGVRKGHVIKELWIEKI